MRLYLLAAGVALAAAAAAPAHPPGGPVPGYYGNGPHDLAPHWHKTYTPYGPVRWYGSGPHDLMPHGHSVGPFGGVRSYGYTPFGPTTSYNGRPGGYYGGFPGYGYPGGFYPR